MCMRWDVRRLWPGCASACGAINESVGGKNTETSGYHETITVMWIRLLDQLWQRRRGLERAEFAAPAVATFEPHRAVFREYYDFDVVGSTEARLNWMEPTLKRLD